MSLNLVVIVHAARFNVGLILLLLFRFLRFGDSESSERALSSKHTRGIHILSPHCHRNGLVSTLQYTARLVFIDFFIVEKAFR